jgi:hypothetical protein
MMRYGEVLGLGSHEYVLEDVFPLQPRPERTEAVYVSLK